jgi:hypothetical protein
MSTNKIWTFVGCSLTYGEGLPGGLSDPDNYTQLIGQHYDVTVNNLSRRGNSNYQIFMTAINEILYNTPDKLFVQWSALNRLWLYPGPDTEFVVSFDHSEDYNYRDIYYSKKELQQFSDQFHILNHDYQNLLTICNYSRILNTLSMNKTGLVFVNGLLTWTPEIMDPLSILNMSDTFSDYTKEILEFDSRSDDEIIRFFNQLNQAAIQLDMKQWVNMFESLKAQQIDIADDIVHPGSKSHHKYADMIINYLEGQNG